MAKPATTQPPVDIDPPFVVAPSVAITGRLESNGQAIVEGKFEGDLIAERVIVSRGGRVSGTIVATEVVIEGNSSSQIYADRISLREGCTVTGELYHAELKLEVGAGFEGMSRRYVGAKQYALKAIRS